MFVCNIYFEVVYNFIDFQGKYPLDELFVLSILGQSCAEEQSWTLLSKTI